MLITRTLHNIEVLILPFKDHQKKLESQKRYREKSRDQLRTKNKEYYIKNRPTILEKSKIWHKNWLDKPGNKERVKQTSVNWRKNNPDYRKENKLRLETQSYILSKKASSRKYYQQHKDKWETKERKEYAKKWWKENKGKVNEYNRRKSISVKKSYDRAREKILHILQQFWCQRCGECDKRCLHLDHINNNGYEDVRKFGNAFSMRRYYLSHPEEAVKNIQVLCSNCNWRKRYEKSSSLRPIKGGGL